MKLKDGRVLYSPTKGFSNFPEGNEPILKASAGDMKGQGLDEVDEKKFDLKSLGIKGVPTADDKLVNPCDQFFPIAPTGTGKAYVPPASQTPAAQPAK